MDKEKAYSLSLDDNQVLDLKNSGKVNTDSSLPTKSIKRIFYDNIVTLFNIINIILFSLLIAVGSYKNLLFIQNFTIYSPSFCCHYYFVI